MDRIIYGPAGIDRRATSRATDRCRATLEAHLKLEVHIVKAPPEDGDDAVVRVVIVGPLAASMYRFRGTLLRTLAEAGHEVLALSPDEDEDIRAELASWGVTYATIPMSRVGLNPLRDARTFVALTKALRDWRADVVLTFASKPVVYGLMAARLAGVKGRSAMITGAGSALTGGVGFKRRSVARVLQLLYRVGLHQADVVFFQNEDDEQLFRSLGLVGERQRCVRINGSGVDLAYYAALPLPPVPVTFLMIARLIKDKGVTEYVDAARSVRGQRPDARFQLLGPLDVNPTAITQAELDAWRDEGIVEYLGSSNDVRPALAGAHVLVLPSYGEGMPRAVLEAMSMGRAILTTDVPGCRDTIEPGVNGYLVPARDFRALADRMVEMVDAADRLAQMGLASRAMAEERFDVHEVNRIIIDALGLHRDERPGHAEGKA